MPVGQMPVGGAKTVDQNTRQMYKGGPPWMCCQHNIIATARDNTKDIPTPRIEIKISEFTGNRTPAAGLEGRDSTKHTTATTTKILTL